MKKSLSPNRRHMFIPDPQISPAVPTQHIDWAAQAIVRYKPDVVVVAGDWWDMHSLSSYDRPGSKKMEGARYAADVEVGNEAFERLVAPMETEQARLIRNKEKSWHPRKVITLGNHENRITRALEAEPKYEGVLSLDHLKTPGFERHEFLEIVEIDGIAYSHYFANTHNGRPIGGTITNRLNKIGTSFVQGHEQGFSYGVQKYPGKLTRHGLVAGSFYLHNEGYRGAQGRDEWRGIVVLNEVNSGSYDIMPLSMDYLEKEFG